MSPLRRKTPLQRGGAIPRTTRIKSANRKRKAANLERAYGGQARLDWTHEQPCYHCGRRAGPYRRVVAAHIQNGGLGRKANAEFTIPLCETPSREGCHDDQHRHGWDVLPFLATAEQRSEAANEINERWQSHLRQTGRARQETEGNV